MLMKLRLDEGETPTGTWDKNNGVEGLGRVGMGASTLSGERAQGRELCCR